VTEVQGSAVVIGAGMAGLAAAQVLSRRYRSVTVLDRDTLPTGIEPRRGVPQGPHPHLLLASGVRELAGLFPGLEDELIEKGALRFDIGTGVCIFRDGSRWPRQATGLDLLAISRPLLEATVRDRVAKEPGVTIRDGVSVTALAGAGGKVTGAFLDTGELIEADLVVDASGRGSRSDRWLAALGFPAPEQVEIKIGVTYTTRIYRRSPGQLDGWQAALVMPTPPDEKRSGFVMAVEGDRWLVTVGGWHIDKPPTDVATFDAYANSLPDPVVTDLIAQAEPLTEPLLYRFPSSRRRRFEDLDRIPAGHVALGDAFCSFNPIYGQGITCAALQAGALDQALERHGAATLEMARDYFRAAAETLATPWQFAVGGDFNYPETTGPRPRGIKLSNWYVRRITKASKRDPDITRVFFAVQHLLAPPSELFKPALVAKVLWLSRGRS
jgi:2-polyprenyl-6-methoxyphenol hydroxylase-like FAD-dependent oxidoreductase